MDNCERRAFIKQAFKYVSFAGFITIAGCGDGGKANNPQPIPETNAITSNDPCDITALTEQDIKHRNALGYAEETPILDQTCDNCKLYIPENDNKKCGTCTLFKGPVAIGGYCTYWADKAV